MGIIGTILLITVAVAIAPFIGALLVYIVGGAFLAIIYVLAVIIELVNGKSVKKALR